METRNPKDESLATFKGLLIGLFFSIPFWMILVIAWIIVSMCLNGCTHLENSPLSPPALSIELTRVVIHVTEDRSTWPVSSRRDNVGGCSSSANEIWIQRGEFTNPEMVKTILGEELWHLLSTADKRLPHPHQVGEK